MTGIDRAVELKSGRMFLLSPNGNLHGPIQSTWETTMRCPVGNNSEQNKATRLDNATAPHPDQGLSIYPV